MIQWTYENAITCQDLTEIVVATDSEKIADVIKNVNGKVFMTNPNIQTGSERVAAVAEHYPDMDVVINLQGDEPFIKPHMLSTLITPFKENEVIMATLANPLTTENYSSPDAVKVITDLKGDALYFSRSPIPYYRTKATVPVYHHMGVYAFRYDFLMKYKTLAQTPLEKAESLEQLRVLENGYKIRVCITKEKTLEINTPEEYALAQSFQYVV
jgi:3-deoxy-manno-octulosonate cytidylyltransferase (CMP-KDO synthetase)